MSPIAVILLALSGFHGTPNVCRNVAINLADLSLNYYSSQLHYENKSDPSDIDEDIQAIKKFAKTCVKRNPKHKGKNN